MLQESSCKAVFPYRHYPLLILLSSLAKLEAGIVRRVLHGQVSRQDLVELAVGVECSLLVYQPFISPFLCHVFCILYIPCNNPNLPI